jgi:pyruvate dehydrogenase E2 component (dihydrolipoamide acetyltransferase)
MAFSITIPRLGWSMEEGTFVRWLKKEGDVVRAGDAVFELEGEKAAQDIEAVDAGILRIPADAPKPGTVVQVGAVIGFLVAEGETVPASVGKSTTTVATPVLQTASSPVIVPVPEPTSSYVAPVAAPSVRRLAREKGVKLSSLAGTGPAGKITADDVRMTPAKPKPNAVAERSQYQKADVASPRARRVAKELGIDWRRLKGTGRDGRVRESDVRHADVEPRSTTNAVVVPVSSRRRTIANRMMASRQQTASVTLTTRIDATNLVGLRQQFKQASNGSIVPSFSDIIMKLVSLSLQQHPLLAARSEGENWVTPASADDLHIGFAVDTDGGLIVPVVKDVANIGLFELAKHTLDLIEKSRSGSLSVSEMQGGVFTMTNLGSFGIDTFTPIINLPETAVLGLGRIRKEPVVVDDKIVAQDQMTLNLTFDHRIIDGAPAARFLQTLGQAIENPSAWLIRGE